MTEVSSFISPSFQAVAVANTCMQLRFRLLGTNAISLSIDRLSSDSLYIDHVETPPSSQKLSRIYWRPSRQNRFKVSISRSGACHQHDHSLALGLLFLIRASDFDFYKYMAVANSCSLPLLSIRSGRNPCRRLRRRSVLLDNHLNHARPEIHDKGPRDG
jgi:hypothetical protein